MLVPAIALLLALDPMPGDGTSLGPGPDPGPPAVEIGAPAGIPLVPDEPLVPLTAVGAAAALVTIAARRRGGNDLVPGDAVGLGPEPLVVFVPGHGTSGPPIFDDLVALMDLDQGDYQVFDYRWVAEEADHVQASEDAPIDGTADALNAYLAGLATGGRPMYLVGFSKGGAGIAELVARWDRGSPVQVPGVIGAALLDPPIADGAQGALQSLGRFWGPIPDDGGYTPVECSWFGLHCTDSRDHLGERSGVEVVVIRNPRAGITNLDDRPEGLRIKDVPDDGPGPLAALLTDPLGYPARVAEAHEAVLHDPRVADCILEEIAEPGSCDINPPYLGSILHPGGGGPRVNLVV